MFSSAITRSICILNKLHRIALPHHCICNWSSTNANRTWNPTSSPLQSIFGSSTKPSTQKIIWNRCFKATGQRSASTSVSKATKILKKMTKLTEQERNEQLQPLLNVGWSMVNGRDAIYKEYLFKDFNQAFSFMCGVALLAEKLNHHPEWFNVYNKVQITMSTHDVGGLSTKDIRVANYMEQQAKRFL